MKLSIIQKFWNLILRLILYDIAIIGHQATQVAFENCVPFTKCIAKNDEKAIDDLVMLTYNLIEYSSNCSETVGKLWFHSKDEATNFIADIANLDNFKSFKI